MELSTFGKDVYLFEHEIVLTFLLVQAATSLYQLLSFFVKSIVLLHFLFNFVLQSLKFKVEGTH